LYGDTSKRSKYFRNVAKGETVDQILKAASCTKALPVCSAQIYPEPIKTLGEIRASGTAASCAEALRLSTLAVAVAGVWAAIA